MKEVVILESPGLEHRGTRPAGFKGLVGWQCLQWAYKSHWLETITLCIKLTLVMLI